MEFVSNSGNPEQCSHSGMFRKQSQGKIKGGYYSVVSQCSYHDLPSNVPHSRVTVCSPIFCRKEGAAVSSVDWRVCAHSDLIPLWWCISD